MEESYVRDRVFLSGVSVRCEIGFHPEEHGILQELLVDIEARLDWSAASRSDDPERLSLDYHLLEAQLRALISARRWNLIEAVAEAAAELVLRSPAVSLVRVRVTKRPQGLPDVASVAVECTRRSFERG